MTIIVLSSPAAPLANSLPVRHFIITTIYCVRERAGAPSKHGGLARADCYARRALRNRRRLNRAARVHYLHGGFAQAFGSRRASAIISWAERAPIVTGPSPVGVQPFVRLSVGGASVCLSG